VPAGAPSPCSRRWYSPRPPARARPSRRASCGRATRRRPRPSAPPSARPERPSRTRDPSRFAQRWERCTHLRKVVAVDAATHLWPLGDAPTAADAPAPPGRAQAHGAAAQGPRARLGQPERLLPAPLHAAVAPATGRGGGRGRRTGTGPCRRPGLGGHRPGGAGGIALDVREGAVGPMQGWHSWQYGKKAPAPALEYARTAATTSFATVLGTGPYATSAPAVRSEAIPGARRLTCARGRAPTASRSARRAPRAKRWRWSRARAEGARTALLSCKEVKV
jgi:hypothetical protein